MSLKAPVFSIDRSIIIRFYLLKKAKNVLDAKSNDFHFCGFLKSFSVFEE